MMTVSVRSRAMSCGSGVLLAVLYGAVVVAAAAAFSSSLQGAFVYDDAKCVVENPVVTEFSGKLTPEVVNRWWYADYWGRPVADKLSHKSWRPFTTLSFMYNYHWAGLEAYTFHVVNVCLHALATLLVMRAAHRIMGPTVSSRMRHTFALTSGALFALHPMHTESVSNITNRSELMSLCLQLLGYLTFAAGSGRGVIGGTAFSLIATPLIVAAALCKETGVMVTALCVAQELVDAGVVTAMATTLAGPPSARPTTKKHQQQTGRKRTKPNTTSKTIGLTSAVVMRCGIVLGATIAFLVYRLQLQGEVPEWYESTNPAANEKSFVVRATTYAYLHWFHFLLLLVPTQFCPDWRNEIPVVASLGDVRAAQAFGFYTALTGTIALGIKLLATQRERSGRVLTMALAWLVLPFVPASNVLFPVGFVVAERVVYSPSVGFCFLFGFVFTLWSAGYRPRPGCPDLPSSDKDEVSDGTARIKQERTTKKQTSTKQQQSPKSRQERDGRQTMLCWAVFVLVLASYTHLLVTRDAEWGNEGLLWEAATNACPHNYVSHVLLGNVYDRGGRVDDAIAAFKEALRHNEYYMHANLNLGRMYRERKSDSRSAIYYLDKALMSADEPEAQAHVLYALGLCHMDVGETETSAKYFIAAAQAAPHNPTYAQYAQQAKQQLQHLQQRKQQEEMLQPKQTGEDTGPVHQTRDSTTPRRRSARRQKRQRRRQDKPADKEGSDASAKQRAEEKATRETRPPSTTTKAPTPTPTPVTRSARSATDEQVPGQPSAPTLTSDATEEKFDSSAVEANTQDPVALFNLGVSSARQGAYEKALTYFEQVAQSSSQWSVDAIHKSGIIRLQLKQEDAALKLMQDAVTAAPDRDDIAFDLAITHAQTGNMDASIRGLQRLESKHGDNPKYPYERGTILFQNGRADEAQQAYLQALECADVSEEGRRYKAKALVNLGVMSFQANETEQALSLFQRALAFDPTHTTAQKNVEAIQTLLASQAQGQQHADEHNG